MLTLNILEEHLLSILTGDKTFEIREQQDRRFYVGQHICLKHTKFELNTNICVNTMLIIKIKYITEYAQKSDHVIFSFDIVGDVMKDLEVVE